MKSSVFISIKNSISFIALLCLFAASMSAQPSDVLAPLCSDEKPPTFEGVQTLCQRYPDPAPPQQIFKIGVPGRQFSSQLIAILQSNQLQGYVHIAGDITINEDFTFKNAIVSIDPNVKITVRAFHKLTLDNAKLFCCNNLWQGIVVEEDGLIETANVTEIEDARVAIDVPCRGIKMKINRTIFNRNPIGIRMGHMGNTPFCIPYILLQQMEEFSGNTFDCTLPINTLIGQDQVGFAGILILGSNLRIGKDASNISTFRNIRNGVVSQSTVPNQTNTIIVARCRFQNILNNGIYQQGGTLTVRFSNFINCFANGIRQDFTTNLTVFNSTFDFNNALPGAASDVHHGIFATRFGLGSLVDISHSTFTISNAMNHGISKGIYLNGGINDVSSQSRIAIAHNTFVVRTGSCYGLHLEGDFTNLLTGASAIFANNFTVANHSSYNWLYGMEMQGDFQNFMVQANHFYGLQRPDNTLNATYSMEILGAGNSNSNEISSNHWHLPTSINSLGDLLNTDMFFSMVVANQNLGSICYNEFLNVTHAGTLRALGQSTYSNNSFAWMAHGPNVESGMIGVQEHQGNRWIFPPVAVNNDLLIADINSIDGYHMRCNANPALSQFIVHTPQATQLFDVQHPFHPFVIMPDVDDEFFAQQAGAPQDCTLDGFTGDVPDVDKFLADGNFAALQGLAPAEIWQQERNLYRHLQMEPSYAAAYSGFPAFIAARQNSAVGKFYEITNILAHGIDAPSNIKTATTTQQQRLTSNITNILNIDEQLQFTTNPAMISNLQMAQLNSGNEVEAAQNELENLQVTYEAPKSSFFQHALVINNQVVGGEIYVDNEKAVNQIVLNALLNQGGELSAGDVAVLQGIAAQCSKTGGTAVIRARALLVDCQDVPNIDETEDCFGVPSMNAEVNTTTASGNRSVSTAPASSTTIGEQVLLNAPFEEGCRFSVFNMNGQMVKSGTLDDSMSFQLPQGCTSGIYLCSINYPSGNIINQKIVVVK